MTDAALPKRAYQVAEAAEMLSLPYRTTLDEIHAGRLGAIKVGRYYLIPTEEIDRLLAPAIQEAS